MCTLFFILTPGIITQTMLTDCDWAKKKEKKKERTYFENDEMFTQLCVCVCVSRMLVSDEIHGPHLYAVHSGERARYCHGTTRTKQNYNTQPARQGKRNMTRPVFFSSSFSSSSSSFQLSVIARMII